MHHIQDINTKWQNHYVELITMGGESVAECPALRIYLMENIIKDYRAAQKDHRPLDMDEIYNVTIKALKTAANY